MKVVIFGNREFASLAWYCITHDSEDEVAAFTVDAPFLGASMLHELPVVDFAEIETHFPPDKYAMFVHLGGLDMNALRIRRFAAARLKGYRLARYVSSRATMWPDFHCGENTAIYEGTIIQPFSSIGENVIIRSGVHISHHVSILDHSFLAPRVCLGGGATVGSRCFVGLNATIRDGVTLAEGCLVGAGAVVTADTEPDGMYLGLPARRVADSQTATSDSDK